MEDAPEDDRDVKLQKASSDLIADFDRSLTPFLRKPNGELRTRVRISETARLTSTLLDPFQELPQLLDPHLPKWLPLLAASYLENLYTQAGRLTRPSSAAPTARAQLLEPLPAAIARLVYTLTKIRGAAVILRFLPYLASPGKERDGARHLLVRLSMRRDMQSLGVLDALVSWALASLRPRDVATTKTADDIDDNDNDDGSPHAPEHQPYFHIGVLSFLAGVLRASVNTSDMDASLSAIFTVVHAVSEADSPIAASIRAYAVARKMVIKVIRSIAVLLLGSGGHQHRDREPHPAIDLVELAIGYLLERLADNDTPVRLAASKALSVITLKLDPDMADEVVDAVLDALNRNVLWAVSAVGTAEPVRDLSAVDPLEWHGLTLTLSHLLYRRSPPARQLPAIIAALLLALAFEKRSTSGSSVGANLSSGQEKELTQFQISAKMVLERLAGLQNRQVEERHGLLLCLASVLDKFPSLVGAPETGLSADNVSVAQRVVREVTDILQAVNQTTYRRPELVAEAANRLIIASLPVLQASSLGAAANTTPTGLQLLCPGFEVVSPDSTQDLLQIVAAVDALPGIPSQVKGLVHHFEATISAGLSRPEKSAIAAAAEAALVLLAFSEPAERNRIVTQWAATTRQKPTSRTTSDHGYFAALTMAHPLTMTATRGSTSDTADAPGRNITTDAILSRWASDKDIDTRVAILQSLTESVVLQDGASAFLDLLAQGLNDYTTTARGDVGSHVRLGALRATRCIWRSLQPGGSARQQEYLRAAVSKLYLNVLRLAAEKLDRVRTEAQAVLSLTLTPSYAVWFNKLTFSSRTYLLALLTLYAQDEYIHPLIMELARADPGAWMAELLAGYVTSADTGNEDLVIAARAALTEYCSMAPANRDDVCTALVRNLSSRQGQDRVLVPTLEIVAFLYRAGLFAGCRGVDPKRLCLLVQKAGYKTGSIRKLEACIHVYGCVAMFEDHAEAAAQEARKRLGALMFHPWPRVRSLVVDELWQLFCDDEAGPRLKSVDWGRADKGAIRNVVSVLGLA
ncbi:Protein byr4 [Verticillium dahliae VDG2]|nr:Protein byr4 [Verticillium dahliae VDG2]